MTIKLEEINKHSFNNFQLRIGVAVGALGTCPAYNFSRQFMFLVTLYSDHDHQVWFGSKQVHTAKGRPQASHPNLSIKFITFSAMNVKTF